MDTGKGGYHRKAIWTIGRGAGEKVQVKRGVPETREGRNHCPFNFSPYKERFISRLAWALFVLLMLKFLTRGQVDQLLILLLDHNPETHLQHTQRKDTNHPILKADREEPPKMMPLTIQTPLTVEIVFWTIAFLRRELKGHSIMIERWHKRIENCGKQCHQTTVVRARRSR